VEGGEGGREIEVDQGGGDRDGGEKETEKERRRRT